MLKAAAQPTDAEIRDLLARYRRITVVGLSPRPERASHSVTAYMISRGYEIDGVRPAQREILGRPVYPRLADVPHPIEILDVFRASEAIPELVDEVLALAERPKVLWLQLGITHADAERRAREAGITVVSDACILVLHKRLMR